jgi:hypothetical protein
MPGEGVVSADGRQDVEIELSGKGAIEGDLRVG